MAKTVTVETMGRRIAEMMAKYNILVQNNQDARMMGVNIEGALRLLEALGIEFEVDKEPYTQFVDIKITSDKEQYLFMIHAIEAKMADKAARQDTLDMFLPVVQELREGKDITDIQYQTDSRTVRVFENGKEAFNVSAGESLGEMLQILLSAILG